MVPDSLTDASRAVRDALRAAGRGLVERDSLIDVLGLALVAREHVLVIGPPGTAKSEAVRRVARVVGGRYFEYLLGRFTEPSEVFGPVNLQRLRDGVVEIETAGMLPDAEVAFLDEVFLGSTAILNTLLQLLNERRFRRGHTDMDCPLRVCVGASNALPEDEMLAAFADRFLLHVFLEPVADALLEDLLRGGWELEREAPVAAAPLVALDTLARASREVDLEAVRPELALAVRTLRSAGLALTDRRVVKLQRLVAAAAALDGRAEADRRDLWPLVWAMPTATGQEVARDALGAQLAAAANEALPAATAEASTSPAAVGRLLTARAERLLAEAPDALDGDRTAWRLALEALAREIDAGFGAALIPESLRVARERVVAELAS